MSAEHAVTVLVVDDDPRVRVSLQHLLDQADDMHVVAVEPDQAMRLIAIYRAPADVALIDIPGANGTGLELVERIATTTVVVAMGLRTSAAQEARAAGAFAFVEKDGDADDILAAIRAAARVQPRHNDQ